MCHTPDPCDTDVTMRGGVGECSVDFDQRVKRSGSGRCGAPARARPPSNRHARMHSSMQFCTA
eukprot:56164-Chlamydomonas_euryale.AAC.15